MTCRRIRERVGSDVPVVGHRTVVDSMVVKSTVVKSTVVKSTVVKSTVVKSTAADSLVADSSVGARHDGGQGVWNVPTGIVARR